MDAVYEGTEVKIITEEVEGCYAFMEVSSPKKKKKCKSHGESLEKAKKPRSAYLLYYFDICSKAVLCEGVRTQAQYIEASGTSCQTDGRGTRHRSYVITTYPLCCYFLMLAFTDSQVAGPSADVPGFRKILPRSNYVLIPKSTVPEESVAQQVDLCLRQGEPDSEAAPQTLSHDTLFSPMGLGSEVELPEHCITRNQNSFTTQGKEPAAFVLEEEPAVELVEGQAYGAVSVVIEETLVDGSGTVAAPTTTGQQTLDEGHLVTIIPNQGKKALAKAATTGNKVPSKKQQEASGETSRPSLETFEAVTQLIVSASSYEMNIEPQWKEVVVEETAEVVSALQSGKEETAERIMKEPENNGTKEAGKRGNAITRQSTAGGTNCKTPTLLIHSTQSTSAKSLPPVTSAHSARSKGREKPAVVAPKRPVRAILPAPAQSCPELGSAYVQWVPVPPNKLKDFEMPKNNSKPAKRSCVKVSGLKPNTLKQLGHPVKQTVEEQSVPSLTDTNQNASSEKGVKILSILSYKHNPSTSLENMSIPAPALLDPYQPLSAAQQEVQRQSTLQLLRKTVLIPESEGELAEAMALIQELNGTQVVLSMGNEETIAIEQTGWPRYYESAATQCALCDFPLFKGGQRYASTSTGTVVKSDKGNVPSTIGKKALAKAATTGNKVPSKKQQEASGETSRPSLETFEAVTQLIVSASSYEMNIEPQWKEVVVEETAEVVSALQSGKEETAERIMKEPENNGTKEAGKRGNAITRQSTAGGTNCKTPTLLIHSTQSTAAKSLPPVTSAHSARSKGREKPAVVAPKRPVRAILPAPAQSCPELGAAYVQWVAVPPNILKDFEMPENNSKPVNTLNPSEISQIQELLYSGYWAFECFTIRDYNDIICGVCGIAPKVEIAQRNTENVLHLKNVQFTWPDFLARDEVNVDDFWSTMEGEAIEQAAFPSSMPVIKFDASIIAPFFPPLMRNSVVVNTEKDKYSFEQTVKAKRSCVKESGLKPNTLKHLGHPVKQTVEEQAVPSLTDTNQNASSEKGVKILSILSYKHNPSTSLDLGLSTARGRGKCKNPSCDYVYKNRHKPLVCPSCGWDLTKDKQGKKPKLFFTWPDFLARDEVNVDDFWSTMEGEAIEQAAFPSSMPVIKFDASIIAPFFPPLMRNFVVVNTEKDKYSCEQIVKGDIGDLVRLIHTGTFKPDQISLYSEKELRDILNCCDIPHRPEDTQEQMRVSLLALYAYIQNGTAKQHPPDLTGGKLYKVCPHQVVCGSKCIVRGESARDHVDLLVSSRYWPPVYAVDMAKQVAVSADVWYPELAAQMWGKNQGCFSDPMELPEYVSCIELQDQQYNMDLTVPENSTVHPITKSSSRWIVCSEVDQETSGDPLSQHHSLSLCQELEPYSAIISTIQDSKTSNVRQQPFSFDNAAYYYLYNRLIDFLTSKDIVNNQIADILQTCQPGEVVIRDSLYRLGVAQINTEVEPEEVEVEQQ
ncbi:UNVERIFIED_CONTAM: hypothetical protein FKN15_029557 [Acipenser sinensis]